MRAGDCRNGLKLLVEFMPEKCHLCKKEGGLCDSHILPEFFYKPMYDAKHRFLVISTDSAKQEKYLQKGLRERLLCSNCEDQFSRYEAYARGVIFGGVEIATKQEAGRLLLKDVDYKKFRLFLLSLLWRMGISKSEFFEAVDLGPYEEKLRLLLIAEDPGDEDHIPCAVTGVLMEGKPGNWFLPPDRIRALGQHCYRIVISGILFLFFVSNQKPPKEAMEHFIKKDTSFTIPVRNIEDIPFLHDICLELGIAMAKRPAALRKT